MKTEHLLLDHYHCTFFLPLIGVTDKDFVPQDRYLKIYQPDAISDKKASTDANDNITPKYLDAEAQAYRYFSPAMRNILFNVASNNPNKGNDRLALSTVKEWRIPAADIANWVIHLGDKNTTHPLKHQVAKVTSVCLYQYFNGIYILAFRVQPKALDAIPVDSPLFDENFTGSLADITQQDPANKEYYEQLQLESWLRFTRLVRLIYLSFPQQNQENKIAPVSLYDAEKVLVSAFENEQRVSMSEKPGQDISPVIRTILNTFIDDAITIDTFFDQYDSLNDDRMFVSVAYGLAGKQHEPEQLEKLFYLALYVDRHEDTFTDMDDYAYTPSAIKTLTKPYHFDLWNGLGSYFGYTGFSNAYLSRGKYFRDLIAPDNVTQIYDRMLIQALFYQASLRYYDNNICRETQALLIQNNMQAIREQRKAFIRFTNQFWFHELTEQMQGKTIFSLQQQALGLTRHYDIIKDELERTDEYLQTIFMEKLTLWGMGVAVVGLYFTAFPLVSSNFKSTIWLWLSEKVPAISLLPKELYTLLIIPGMLLTLMYLIIRLKNKIVFLLAK